MFNFASKDPVKMSLNPEAILRSAIRTQKKIEEREAKLRRQKIEREARLKKEREEEEAKITKAFEIATSHILQILAMRRGEAMASADILRHLNARLNESNTGDRILNDETKRIISKHGNFIGILCELSENEYIQQCYDGKIHDIYFIYCFSESSFY